jgi:outer membrane immunogenic protein
MRSRRLTALTVGFILTTTLSGAAFAADVEAYSPYDWSGFYVGGHVGYGWIDLKGSHESVNASETIDPDFVDTGEGSFDLDDDDLVGGFQLGFNYQIDNLVLGIEGDLSLTGFSKKLTNEVPPESVSFDTDFLATIRARAGLAMDNVLLYATAGAAWTDTNYEIEDNGFPGGPIDPVTQGDLDLDDIGFVVGGGAEYALNEDWSIRAEALYYIFDDKEDTEDLVTDSEVGDFIKLDDIFVIRVGVNFHL